MSVTRYFLPAALALQLSTGMAQLPTPCRNPGKWINPAPELAPNRAEIHPSIRGLAGRLTSI